MKEKVPGLFAYFTIFRHRDNEAALQLLSNDSKINIFDRLHIGISKVRLRVPKRLLNFGTYRITVTLASNFNTAGYRVDRNINLLMFEMHDYTAEWGTRRAGFFSTLIDWEIV